MILRLILVLKRRKKKASNDSDSDKRSSQVSHDSQASSDDDSNAVKSINRRKRIQKIDFWISKNTSDVDGLENARSGILKQPTSTWWSKVCDNEGGTKETSIDDWVDSMKAYIEGTNPGLVMDRAR